MRIARSHIVPAVFSLFLFTASIRAVDFGQVDTFEDATTLGWSNGGTSAAPVANIASGGPAGADDNFIQTNADGGGSGGRLTTFNRDPRWLGNYIAQGVSAIEVDLNNFSTVNLSIRLAFKSATFNGAPSYLSEPFLLPANSGWQHALFSVTPAAMKALAGPAPFDTFFANGIAEFRIIHEVGSNNSNGDFVVGQLGIDNIRAVPEPGGVILVGSGLVAFGLTRLRRRQRA